ncbi:PilZ domain-containing protein [Candidatus Hydrogenedentota bacterium]
MEDKNASIKRPEGSFKLLPAETRMFKTGIVMYVTQNPPKEEVPRQEVTLLGWQEPLFLLTTVPMPSSRFLEGTSWSLRYILDGRVYGFHTQVARLIREPFLVMILKYPTSIEAVSIRKYERFTTLLVGEASRGTTATQIAVYDLSLGGARFQSIQEFAAGDTVELSFVLPDGAQIEGIRCEIKNVLKDKAYYFTGVSFYSADNPEMMKLATFFQEAT